MKTLIKLLCLQFIAISVSCTHKETPLWKPADNPIYTRWTASVDPAKPWLSYPRPDLKRNAWMSLNGLWDYSITVKDTRPEKWDGKILVPYPVESALSGVKMKVTEKESIWYRRTFSVPNVWKKKHIILNFEASDWETRVFVDGKEAGFHRGGYDPFSFDITSLLSSVKEHELLVSVWDPTDKGEQPRGKQVNEPGGIWYTQSSGIWQTVWIEPVYEDYIKSFRITTDADNGLIKITADAESRSGATITIKAKDGKKTIAEASGSPGQEISIKIDKAKLWSPDSPFLYDLTITMRNPKDVCDEVSSYAGIRKISIGRDQDQFTRILLNNKFVYQNGPLDQGFWPDGLYTPPTEQAMVYDLTMTKKMGFNMLRKHVKVENRIFYYWCDKLGILVWQDMPSGDKSIWGDMPDIAKSKEAADQYVIELKRMIETKYNNPSIIMWVPFNEGWGQFNTAGITSLIADYDKTRLVNSSSGWTDRGTGNINDIHHYPDPAAPAAEENRAIVLGEFGGLGLPVSNHTWEQKNWGYRNMEDTLQLLARYESYYEVVNRLVKEKGLSATIYTQTTDVETETNGLMTYDREIVKMGADNIFKANNNIIPPSIESPQRIFTDSFKVSLGNVRPAGTIFYTTDGTDPVAKGIKYDGPFTITSTTTLKAYTKWEDYTSRVASYTIEKKEAITAQNPAAVRKGLKATIYSGNFSTMPDFTGIKPLFSLIVPVVDYKVATKDSLFAIVFEGYISIPDDGVYGLSVNSDDGSRLTVDDSETVLNDGIHGMKEEGFSAPLRKGYHKLRIEYFQRVGGVGLEFYVQTPDQKKQIVPASWLYN